MTIIDRYIFKQLTNIFIILLLILTGLAWMMQIISMMNFILKYGVEFNNFIGLTALMLPFIVSIIIPFVTFIAIIFIYNKMILENEVSVMVASGLAPRQIARPAIILAIIITFINLMLTVWIVPKTQERFYTTQWNLRYGLAHLKLQEANFTELAKGLVVYVNKVSDHDLSELMLSDTRKTDTQFTIFAEKGKLVTTLHGLSIVMTNGSLQTLGKTNAVGKFEYLNMNLDMLDRSGNYSFKARRVPTLTLMQESLNAETTKQQKMILAELCSRFYSPFMNLILTVLCITIMLKTSLLRRKTSFAPALAVLSMMASMSIYMSVSNMITSLTEFIVFGLCLAVAFVILLFVLLKK